MPLIYKNITKQNHDFISEEAFINQNQNNTQFAEDKNTSNYDDIFEKNKLDFYELNNMIFQNSQNE